MPKDIALIQEIVCRSRKCVYNLGFCALVVCPKLCVVNLSAFLHFRLLLPVSQAGCYPVVFCPWTKPSCIAMYLFYLLVATQVLIFLTLFIHLVFSFL